MDKKEVLNQIKESLKALFSSEAPVVETEVEVSMFKVETVDGLVFESEGEMLVIGAPILRVGEDGNMIPVEDGTYETAVGYSINVLDGKVESIVEAPEVEVEIENPSEEPMSNEYGLQIAELNKKVESLVSIVSKLVEMNSDIESKVTELSAQPAVQTISFEKLSPEEVRVERLKNLVKK